MWSVHAGVTDAAEHWTPPSVILGVIRVATALTLSTEEGTETTL